MKKQFHSGKWARIPVRTISVFTIILGVASMAMAAFTAGGNGSGVHEEEAGGAAKDSVESVAAFMDVYKVLMSPRCMNCHPAGNVPLQGDDNHLHAMYPQRGKEGKGLYAMKCMNCHQPENVSGLHTPPGNPNWHLPPSDMKMVFQGKTPHELARQLLDPSQNGHKDMKALIAHADDALVKWGWQPGEGRTLPPLTHAEFKKAWITWLQSGAYAPAK